VRPPQELLRICAADERGELSLAEWMDMSPNYRAMIAMDSCGRGRSAEVFMPELREALARFDDGKEDEFDPDRAINDLE
jgi:hypothetical protein